MLLLFLHTTPCTMELACRAYLVRVLTMGIEHDESSIRKRHKVLTREDIDRLTLLTVDADRYDAMLVVHRMKVFVAADLYVHMARVVLSEKRYVHLLHVPKGCGIDRLMDGLRHLHARVLLAACRAYEIHIGVFFVGTGRLAESADKKSHGNEMMSILLGVCFMVLPVGFEPTTDSFEGCYSIQLS